MLNAPIAGDRGALCPLPSSPPAASIAMHSRFGTRRDLHSRPHLGAFQGAAMERETVSGPDTEDQTAMPEWRVYAPEFPQWYVWRGVARHYYARGPRSSPPRGVRAPNPEELRGAISPGQNSTRP